MRSQQYNLFFAICVGLLLLSVAACNGLGAEVDPSKLPSAFSGTVDFARDVRPLLEASCLKCHGTEKPKSGFRLDSREHALAGGDNGIDIVPGESANSRLIHFVSGLVEDMQMPPKGKAPALTPEQIGLLRAWIDAGAQWSDDAKVESPAHWAFQPVKRPAVPSGFSEANPIDAFVRSKLSENKITPAREADRVTLVRRLYFVMLGVPPAPQEVSAFVADTEPRAWERLVDGVLADSRYGERWARHWLDVIRFAESNGFETNRERPNAWKFRDYVIASLNDDKPFDQFVREQIAGDAMGADVATGFLVAGPVDIVGSPDPALTAQQRADQLDDMVNTTGTAFLGLTLGCARCHSHKFDPISHKEYYAMSAIFAGVKHGDRALPLPGETAHEIAILETRIKDLETKLEAFLPKTANGAPLRPPVNARTNEEKFAATDARFVRFTILASNGAEPCIDELEVWSGNRNVAAKTNGAKATASGTLPGFDIHKLEHINDGLVGNSHSWISSEAGKGWVQLEFPTTERIDRIVWSRDREGQFKDRVPTQYRIEAGIEPSSVTVVASSEDRQPFGGNKPQYVFSGANADQGKRWLEELEKAKPQREALKKAPMIYAGAFSEPGATHRLNRGDPMQKREEVAPGTLAIFKPLTLATNSPEQQRRVQLANWIANSDNPLTARVFVNRVWQHHFGVGLVSTPNDFGKNGALPSHPELLDWLASEFVENGWSTKKLHRAILTSQTWRQADAPNKDATKIDASNRLLWRFTPRRLEAESIRDSILSVSGNLDRTMGGPSFFLHDVDRENVYHYRPKEKFGPAESRRMIYALKVRMEQDGIFGSFDCPDGSLVMPKRSVSTTPLQALNLFNSEFMLQQSQILAERIRREGGADSQTQIRRAWELVYQRVPTQRESNDAIQFAAAEGMPALCRAILNSNEFLFIP